MNNTGKLITGIAVGVAAGALLGVLLAPEKGKATRKKLQKNGMALKDNMRSRFNTLMDDMVNEYETIKEKTNDLLDKGKAKKDALKADARHSLS